MKKTTSVITALLFYLSGLSAQNETTLSREEPANSVGISWGFGNLKKQDLIFSPFIHQSWSPVHMEVSYERSGRLEQRAGIRFGQYSAHTGELFSYILEGETYTKLGHTFTQVDLNYSLGLELKENEQWQFILGGRFRNRFQIADYDFGPAEPFAYHIPLGLDAWFSLKFAPVTRHHFETNLYLPLFSYVARSPYMGQDDGYLDRISVHGDLKIFFEHLKSGEVQSWGTSQIVDLDLGYHYALSDRWELGAAYRFSMNLHSKPAQFRSYEQLFLIHTAFKF